MAQPGAFKRAMASGRAIAALSGGTTQFRQQARMRLNVIVLLHNPLARPAVGTNECFHTDETQRQRSDEFKQLGAGRLGLTNAGFPVASTPCTAKSFLARSIPMVTMAVMDALFHKASELMSVRASHRGT